MDASRWRFDELVEVGSISIPGGRLACGDPWWSFDGVPVVVDVEPGRYPVRLCLASFDRTARRGCAAVELRLRPDVVPDRWELLPVRSVYLKGERGGFRTEVSQIGIGAEAALTGGGGRMSLAAERGSVVTIAGSAESGTMEDSELGGFVYFRVEGQHEECWAWGGVGSDGELSALVVDLGLLDLHPVERPLPWRG